MMYSYLSEFKNFPEVSRVYDCLYALKNRIVDCNYSYPKSEYDSCANDFKRIIEIAKELKNEKLANATKVFEIYFQVFISLASYFDAIEKRKYKDSWDLLQDCIDAIRFVLKFVEDRTELDGLLELLCRYEELYPYKTFCSSEYVVSKAHCSICGKSMLGLECPHIKGNIYWGEVCVECIDKIETMQAVCLVSHPEDKRCIIELSEDKRSEDEKFAKLNAFLDLNLNRLQMFSLNIVTEYRKEKALVGRNDKCPCGSGLKYKRCHGKNLSYKHERVIVSPKQIVKII